MELSKDLSCEAGSFSHHHNPHRCFQSRGFISPGWNRGLWVCLTPQLFLPVYLHINVGPSCLQATASPGPPATALSSLPGCPSPPFLQVWMNVSSLTPWLSDFHIVQFSVSSGCFLVLNLLLSLFWLCKEAKCVYLHLHLGCKSPRLFLIQTSFTLFFMFYNCYDL